MNGKGSSPRSCFGQKFRANYDEIDWSKKPAAREPYVSIKDDGIVVIDPKAMDKIVEWRLNGGKFEGEPSVGIRNDGIVTVDGRPLNEPDKY